MRTLHSVLLASSLALFGCSHSNSTGGAAQASSGGSGSVFGHSTDPVADAQTLQGAWRLTGATYEGRPIHNDVRWVVDGDHYTVHLGQAEETWQFKLDSGTGHNQILAKHGDNPLASQGYTGGALTGIYELSGEKFRVCFDMTGRQYPTSFAAPKGSRQIIYEFAREKD
jgi:uncharacterized protein (TIGR03067 family)